MKAFIAENALEEVCLEYFADLGWEVLHGPTIAHDQPAAERKSYEDVLLDGRLRSAITRLNPGLTPTEVDQVVGIVRRPESADLMAENWRIYRLLVEGVRLERRGRTGETRYEQVWPIDWDHPENNEFVAVNQFTVIENKRNRRPDIVAFVNGLPLGLLELKMPGEPSATMTGAWKQIRTYADQIPSLLAYNAVAVIATGTQAAMGALGGAFEHYAPWKTIDGKELAPKGTPQVETLIKGVFPPAVFLDLIRNFVEYADESSGLVKKVAKYHQYWAVNKAVHSTVEAIKRRDGRAGVVWHTQGSGKSLEMVFYARKVARHPEMKNPTLVMLTDRNDLDDQLINDFFAPSRTLPETPVQAETREHLKQLLGNRASGGIIFSTMQKFGLSKEDRAAARQFPLLSDRENVVVIADEAHRTQYDTIDGLARNLRDALPHGAFLGFTGTPIESDDRNTRSLFGEYIDVYDMTQAVEDGATVRVFYEGRLAKVELPEEAIKDLDRGFEVVTERAEKDVRKRLKSRWARVEAIVGAEKRINQIAEDIIKHWEDRSSTLAGKGLIVCMSRRICVQLYDAIVKLRPDWHDPDPEKGKIKVVITSSADEGPELAKHSYNKDVQRQLKDRAKDPNDPLELVIVRDMWLTGFDSPPMHTMYVDKPMQGAGLMQAIARVNRTFRDKPNGLVVDYIGLAESLRSALADYTERDRKFEEVGAPVEEAVLLLQEKIEVLNELLYGCPWREALASGSDQARLEALAVGLEHLLEGLPNGVPQAFTHHARIAKQAFTLAVSSPDCRKYRDDLAYFDALAVELRRSGDGTGTTDETEMPLAMRQVISDAITPAGIVDIYAKLGIDKPDLSIIDENFAKRLKTDPHPHLKIEALRRTLITEIKKAGKTNRVREKKFSDLLQKALNAYVNRSLQAADVIQRLVELAQQLKFEYERGEQLGLREDELAFYDAVCQNDSAVLELGDDTLRAIAHELVDLVRANTTVDWDKKEQVRAKLRALVRRLLAKYHYPPDKQEAAVAQVLEQAELLAAEVAA